MLDQKGRLRGLDCRCLHRWSLQGLVVRIHRVTIWLPMLGEFRLRLIDTNHLLIQVQKHPLVIEHLVLHGDTVHNFHATSSLHSSRLNDEFTTRRFHKFRVDPDVPDGWLTLIEIQERNSLVTLGNDTKRTTVIGKKKKRIRYTFGDFSETYCSKIANHKVFASLRAHTRPYTCRPNLKLIIWNTELLCRRRPVIYSYHYRGSGFERRIIENCPKIWIWTKNAKV